MKVASVSQFGHSLVAPRFRSSENLVLLFSIVLAACALEASLLLWWLPAFSLVGHPGFYPVSEDPLPWLIGSGPQAVHHFAALLASITVPYLIALFAAGRLNSRAALVVAVAGACVFSLTMLFTFPAGARDLFHNIVDGRDLWLHGVNPMLVAPSAMTGDPLSRYVTTWGQYPAGYGPLWYLLTAPSAFLGGVGRNGNIIAFKALPLFFELLSLGAIAGIVHRVNQKRVVAAVICFGWNPLVLWEVAGNGHNDSVMMAFVLLSILALLSSKWPFAFPLLACSILVKFVSVILFPLFVLWVMRRHGRRAAARLAAGLVGAAAVVILVFVPFWAGSLTFRGLLAPSSGFISSPGLALLRLGGIEAPQGSIMPMLRETAVALEVKVALTATFALLFGVALLLVKPTADSLLDTAITGMFLFLVLVVWWFWPWYVIWALALAALRPGTSLNRLIVLFSFTGFGVYILAVSNAYAGLFGRIPLQFTEPLLIFLAPLVYATRYVWPPEALWRDRRRLAGRRRRFRLEDLDPSHPV